MHRTPPLGAAGLGLDPFQVRGALVDHGPDPGEELQVLGLSLFEGGPVHQLVAGVHVSPRVVGAGDAPAGYE
ncbi:MAG: hypothetical protein ACRCXL_01335 [Dermatophilaceae bacterium]